MTHKIKTQGVFDDLPNTRGKERDTSGASPVEKGKGGNENRKGDLLTGFIGKGATTKVEWTSEKGGYYHEGKGKRGEQPSRWRRRR